MPTRNAVDCLGYRPPLILGAACSRSGRNTSKSTIAFSRSRSSPLGFFLKTGSRRSVSCGYPADEFLNLYQHFCCVGLAHLWPFQLPNDFGLSPHIDLSVAGKCGHDTLMAEVLGPSFEIFRRFADFLPQARKRLSKRMRVEVGQTCCRKCLLENGPDRRGVGPAPPIQPDGFEAMFRPEDYARCRKDRIV